MSWDLQIPLIVFLLYGDEAAVRAVLALLFSSMKVMWMFMIFASGSLGLQLKSRGKFGGEHPYFKFPFHSIVNWNYFSKYFLKCSFLGAFLHLRNRGVAKPWDCPRSQYRRPVYFNDCSNGKVACFHRKCSQLPPLPNIHFSLTRSVFWWFNITVCHYVISILNTFMWAWASYPYFAIFFLQITCFYSLFKIRVFLLKQELLYILSMCS